MAKTVSHARAFASVPALDLAQERRRISFPVNRETQLSQKHGFKSAFHRVSVSDPSDPDKTVLIGEVPQARPHILYGDAMDFALGRFEDAGIPFKLRTSVIGRKNFNLYQEYLFDQPVSPPDGEGISPMAFVNGSYTKGSPLSVHFGTYRFICDNGAITSLGKPTTISVNSRNWDSIRRRGFADQFKAALDHYADVSAFYGRLGGIPLSDALDGILKPKAIPFCMRKKVIGELEKERVVRVNIETDREDGEKYKALAEGDFHKPDLIAVTADVSAWDVYNRFTHIATHLSSPARVMIACKSIDKVFSKIASAA